MTPHDRTLHDPALDDSAPDDRTLDDVFTALGDPTRRGLLALLADGERTTGSLAQPFELSRPAISKHLKVLGEAGLVRRRRHGRHQVYTLEAERLARAAEWLVGYSQFWSGSLAALKGHLERESGA